MSDERIHKVGDIFCDGQSRFVIFQVDERPAAGIYNGRYKLRLIPNRNGAYFHGTDSGLQHMRKLSDQEKAFFLLKLENYNDK